MVVCRFFLNGSCRFGDNCRNEHPGDQSRNQVQPRNGFISDSRDSPRNPFGTPPPPRGGDSYRPGQQRVVGQTYGSGSGVSTRKNEREYRLDADSIKNDLTIDLPEWPFSNYAGANNTDCPKQFFNPVMEQSPEEIRVEYYLAKLQGREAEAQQTEVNAHRLAMQEIETVRKDIHSAMMRVIAAKREHPNRWDLIDDANKDWSNPNPFKPAPLPSAASVGGVSRGFGQPSQPPAFGQPNQTPAFGQPSQTPAFGQPSQASAFGQPSQASAFGQPSQTPAFGQPSQTPAFGQPSKIPAFGQFSNNAQQPSFGQASQAEKSGGFGQPSVLGQQQSAFGNPSTTPSSGGFGQPSPLGQQTTAFGQPSTMGRGTAFGQASTPGGGVAAGAFGRNSQLGQQANPFAQKSATASPFAQIGSQQGQQNGLAQPSAFGQPSVQTPSTNPFSQPSRPTGTNAFGHTSQAGPPNPFGQPSQHTQTNTFGQPGAQPAKSNPFGQPSTGTGVFGQSPAPPSAFGQASNNGAKRSAFGRPLQPSSDFGAAAQQASAFNRSTSNGFNTTSSLSLNKSAPAMNGAGNYTIDPPDSMIRDADPPQDIVAGRINELEEAYKYVLDTGSFKDGIMPEIAPLHIWVGWGSMERKFKT